MSKETLVGGDVPGVANSPSTELSVAEDNVLLRGGEVNRADHELSSEDLECEEGEDGMFRCALLFLLCGSVRGGRI